MKEKFPFPMPDFPGLSRAECGPILLVPGGTYAVDTTTREGSEILFMRCLTPATGTMEMMMRRTRTGGGAGSDRYTTFAPGEWIVHLTLRTHALLW